MRTARSLIAGASLLLLSSWPMLARAESLLVLETKIPLGNVTGCIDHMAFDQARRRLFVAELGNNTIGVVDLKASKVIQRITGLKKPQGIAYVPWSDLLYVANAGDGSVRMFKSPDYAPAGRIDLGNDADNIRIDAATRHILVGYGDGALAVIDAANNSKLLDMPLKAHPESFQLDPKQNQVFVNVPVARAISVLNLATGQQQASWPMRYGDNFAMAIDPETQRVLVAFRKPAKLVAFAAKDGASVAEADICGDTDDVFVDAKRRRIYVSCGEGFLDVLDASHISYRRLARIPTVSGARTALYVPELDRLLLAVRARSGQPAAIWVYSPVP